MPITPSVIRSLAATPPRPRALAGMIHGADIAAPAASDCVKNPRRVAPSGPINSALIGRSPWLVRMHLPWSIRPGFGRSHVLEGPFAFYKPEAQAKEHYIFLRLRFRLVNLGSPRTSLRPRPPRQVPIPDSVQHVGGATGELVLDERRDRGGLGVDLDRRDPGHPCSLHGGRDVVEQAARADAEDQVEAAFEFAPESGELAGR